MTRFPGQWFGIWPVVLMLGGGWSSSGRAQQPSIRYTQGTIHGFLEMRAEDGHVVAMGDSTQVVRGEQVTSRTTFAFKDGSVDDEATVFTQHGKFRLVSDHHVQKGPSFPHPSDVLIDARGGVVISHTPGKDGKDEAKVDRATMSPEMVNGLVPLVLQQLKADVQTITVPMLVMIPKPRMVKLVISNRGEDNVSVVGVTRKATHYEIKVDLGGVVGLIAPMIGKAPPNIQIWIIGGLTTTFAREVGPLYPEGPLMTIQLASPVWPGK